MNFKVGEIVKVLPGPELEELGEKPTYGIVEGLGRPEETGIIYTYYVYCIEEGESLWYNAIRLTRLIPNDRAAL